MSIVINLMAVPQRIEPDRWTAVYEESLRLLQAYDFMDSFQAQRNGLEYQFAAKSRDMENFLGTKYRGWRSIGDMHTGEGTEDYILFGDVHAYQSSEKTVDKGGDILLSLLDGTNLSEKQSGCINLWGGRTEGEDSHIYLLAIACLFAVRFPEAVMVTGSISAGQCRRAVRWANRYLDAPIEVPVNGQMDRFLKRLKKLPVSRGKMLEAFFELTIEAKDHKMGELLKGTFSDKEISSYYKRRLRRFRPDQRGFLSVLKEYLEMGFYFEELCRIAVEDPDGPKAPPEDFLAHMLEFRLHVKEKETGDFTKLSVKQGDSERVDSAEEELIRVLGMFFGVANSNVNAYYPLEKICQDCKKVFGNRCDVNQVMEHLIRAEKAGARKASLQALLYDMPDSIFKQKAEMAKEKQQAGKYDINAYRELDNFTPGCSIRPELEADLIKNFCAIHRYAEKEFENFRVLNRTERENYFISHNQRVLLEEKVWNRIFEKVMDDEYIIRIYGLFGINSERREGYLFCRNLFASLEALDYFWERTADEIQGS